MNSSFQACGCPDQRHSLNSKGLGRFADGMFHDALALGWDEHQAEQATSTSKENVWVLYFTGACEGIFRSGRGGELARYGEVFSEMEISRSNHQTSFLTLLSWVGHHLELIKRATTLVERPGGQDAKYSLLKPARPWKNRRRHL